MKKIIFNMLFLFGITTAVSAQAYDPVPMAVTPANQAQNNAWYYTSQNANSAEIYRSYWVWDKASVGWVKRVELVTPATYMPAINVDPRYKILNKNDEVCMNNTCMINTQTKPGGQ
jgi:hypothetical protein